MQKPNFEIKLLANCQEHIPALAKLWYEEISRHWFPNSSIAEAKQKLVAHANTEKLPVAFVAFANGEPIGMACLRETEGVVNGKSPRLGGLVVNPKYRGKQIGETLINIVKDRAKKLGYQTLYLRAFDSTIPNWYARLGWQKIGTEEAFGHLVIIMSIAL